MGLESVISSRWVEEIWFRDNTLSAKGLVSSESSSSDWDGEVREVGRSCFILLSSLQGSVGNPIQYGQ